MQHSDAYVPVLEPSRRFDQMPHAVMAGDQGLFNGWEDRVTGYYPDQNASTMGRLRTPLDNLVMAPYGCPGSLGMIPTEPGSNDLVIDQHPYLLVTATWTPSIYGNGRPSGGNDPLTAGPPRPEVRNLALHYRRESGASKTRYNDVPDGRVFPATGSQDGASYVQYMDTRAALEPYNPDPATGQHRETMMRMPPGPSHGWTGVPVIDTMVQDSQKRKKLVQQKNVRQNRLASSTYAGQTFSQQTAHVQNPSGTSGTVPSWRSRG